MKTRSVLYLVSALCILGATLSSCGALSRDGVASLPVGPGATSQATAVAVGTAVPSPTAAEPTVSAVPATADPIPADWLAYTDTTYGFRIHYPGDWAYKPLEMGGPGMPEDWPVKGAVLFFPQSMGEALDREGPPDPNAPVAVAPFSIEICVGPVDALRRAYPEAGASEVTVMGGNQVAIERDTYDDYNTVRYVFSSPSDEEVHVVLIDVHSGFSERATANPEYVDVIVRVAASLEFVGEQQADAGAASQTRVMTRDAGRAPAMPVFRRPPDNIAWRTAS